MARQPATQTQTRQTLTGSRIRERRSATGLRQADLARAVGISASYLNLIEHNKRRIGGKLLVDIARYLDVEPAQLSEGADASVLDALHQAARDSRPAFGPAPELTRIEELSGRFPGWTGVLAAQRRRIASLEAVIDGLRDRLAHDPVLAEAMHEVLSSVAAIRSTADILVREVDIDPQWRGRFHRNLHEEAERLSRRATSMLAHFEDQETRSDTPSTPQETVEAMYEAADHHFPAIEEGGAGAIDAVLEQAAGMGDATTAALARKMLAGYAADAARLPLAGFAAAAAEHGYDPGALLPLAGGDVALVLRRLSCLPRGADPAMPLFGLAICDGSGALIFRRRIQAFTIPRFGAGCPLSPLYQALARPMVPETGLVEMPNGARFRTWSICQPHAQAAFGEEPVLQSTMLLRAEEDGAAQGAEAPRAIGPGCHVCPREDCRARRAASLLD